MTYPAKITSMSYAAEAPPCHSLWLLNSTSPISFDDVPILDFLRLELTYRRGCVLATRRDETRRARPAETTLVLLRNRCNDGSFKSKEGEGGERGKRPLRVAVFMNLLGARVSS